MPLWRKRTPIPTHSERMLELRKDDDGEICEVTGCGHYAECPTQFSCATVAFCIGAYVMKGRKHPAQAIDARSGKTGTGLTRKGESAVPKECAMISMPCDTMGAFRR